MSILEEPNIWKNFKKSSTWHYDPKGDTREQTYNILCKFKGDWSEAINLSLENCVEHAVRHDGGEIRTAESDILISSEEVDLMNASGKSDVSILYYNEIYNLEYFDDNGNERVVKNNHPAYAPLFKMIEAVGMYDLHLARVHIQRLGQISPFHLDLQMSYDLQYDTPDWKKRYRDHGADKDPLKLRRMFIQLLPWDYGHIWQFGNTVYQGYDAGECLTFDWQNMPHATANMGWTPRINLQATGFVNDRFDWLLKNGSKDYVIDLH